MSSGDKKDWELFNCSEQHEIDYVKNQYTDQDGVETWINKECKSGGKIKNTTHKALYTMLKDAGFTKK